MRKLKSIFLLFFVVNFGFSQVPETINMDLFLSENSPVAQYITALENDKEGNIWLSSLRGLLKFDGYKFDLFVNDPNDPMSLVNNRIFNTHLSQDGNLWIAAEYGVQVYNSERNTFDLKLETFTNSRKDIYDVAYYDIADLDSSHLLFATKKGLLVYNKSNDSVEKLDTLVPESYRDNKAFSTHVLRIEPDNVDQNVLWLLTRIGIFKYLKKERRAEKINGPFDENFLGNSERGFSMQILGNEVLIHSLHKDLYSFHKISGLWKHLNPGSDRYIRNLLKIGDDYAMVIYVNYNPEIISKEQEGLKPIKVNFDARLRERHFSQASLDANGFLISINGTKKLMKSREALIPTNRKLKLYKKNLKVNGINHSGSLNKLENYQRSIDFQVNLNYPDPADSFQYYYTLDNKEHWNLLDETRKVELDHLKAGKHTVYTKALSNEKVIESEIISFQILPYFYESWWFMFGVLGGLGAIVFGFYWQSRGRKKEKEQFESQLLGLQMNALRSQMNPHFLFNSLNSIKNYVVNKGPDEAADYITRFSLLMRKILENSRKNILNLEQEIETLKLYVEMEQMRFNFQFKYEFNIDPEIDISSFKVAPMLLQPFIENAIWHGLLNKKGDCLLKIDFIAVGQNVKCTIIDNGIGREKAIESREKSAVNQESLGMKITDDRIRSINALYKINATAEIEDLLDHNNLPIGTRVNVFLPEIR